MMDLIAAITSTATTRFSVKTGELLHKSVRYSDSYYFRAVAYIS